MPLYQSRDIKLRKQCDQCLEMFYPKVKRPKYCDKCLKERFELRKQRMHKSIENRRSKAIILNNKPKDI